jgi:hypothetical protein
MLFRRRASVVVIRWQSHRWFEFGWFEFGLSLHTARSMLAAIYEGQ